MEFYFELNFFFKVLKNYINYKNSNKQTNQFVYYKNIPKKIHLISSLRMRITLLRKFHYPD